MARKIRKRNENTEIPPGDLIRLYQGDALERLRKRRRDKLLAVIDKHKAGIIMALTKDYSSLGIKKYNPVMMIPEVIRLSKLGKTKVSIATAFGVATKTLAEWEKKYPEFKDAMSLAKTYAQAWWEDLGQLMQFDNKFNSNMYALQMKVRFDWDKQDPIVQINNTVGEQKTVNANIDLSNVPLDKLRKVRDLLKESEAADIEVKEIKE